MNSENYKNKHKLASMIPQHWYWNIHPEQFCPKTRNTNSSKNIYIRAYTNLLNVFAHYHSRTWNRWIKHKTTNLILNPLNNLILNPLPRYTLELFSSNKVGFIIKLLKLLESSWRKYKKFKKKKFLEKLLTMK